MSDQGSNKPTKFVDEPTALLCPVCKSVFSDPVISIKCGHTFCTSCIKSLIESGQNCPVDDQNCDSGQLVVNRAVKEQVNDLMIYCCHGVKCLEEGVLELDQDGCQETIRLGNRDAHESICQFVRVECPIGGSVCGKLQKYKLDEHMALCSRVPCPYTQFGCGFSGTSDAVAQHKLQCSFRDESQLLVIAMKEIKAVKMTNEELRKDLTRAMKATEKLNVERSTMAKQLEHQAMTITTLTSRMDRLEAELEVFRSVRLRHPSNQDRVTSEITPISNRRAGRSETRHKRWSVDSVGSAASASWDVSSKANFVWEMPFTVKCIGTFKGHKGTIWSMVTYHNNMYSGSSDGSIKVWDISDLRKGCLKTVAAHKDCTLCLAIGRGVLYSAGTDLCLRSWQLESLEEVGVVQNAHDGMVSAMVCSKDYLYTSSFGCIKVWNATTLKEIHNISGISQSWVRALEYDRRKDHLYSCSFNKIHIWRGHDDFGLEEEMETDFGALYSLAVTKKHIITGTHNQNIQVYDISTRKHLCTLSGHIGIVTVLKVTESLHGGYMFSGSSDTTVQVWNLENMLPILALQRHEKPVRSIAVYQDSVFTGSEDMEIKVFRHFKL